ncbi:hypothetical protein SAMN04489730_4618 [Amycolatopsis australiensis]|uniref:Uncharacterized protein n=1 Tax=Amycolatopsis australiensis TaxID=546364 RepID=A0A1K1S4B6_9PSEU|nr:hypothetical protein SAMN04489730_4618 [Amycolatopsis australiensis]
MGAGLGVTGLLTQTDRVSQAGTTAKRKQAAAAWIGFRAAMHLPLRVSVR